MHAFLDCSGNLPALMLRHNINSIQYGRCVVIQSREDGGVKSVQCWKDGSGRAAGIVFGLPNPDEFQVPNVGPQESLDAAFVQCVKSIEMDKTREEAVAIFLEAVLHPSNIWPDGFADLIRECAVC